jgi:hypothetical protein
MLFSARGRYLEATAMQRLKKYEQFAARCLQEARSTTDPRLKAFWAEMALEWQRLIGDRKGSKSEHTPVQRHEMDPGD